MSVNLLLKRGNMISTRNIFELILFIYAINCMPLMYLFFKSCMAANIEYENVYIEIKIHLCLIIMSESPSYFKSIVILIEDIFYRIETLFEEIFKLFLKFI